MYNYRFLLRKSVLIYILYILQIQLGYPIIRINIIIPGNTASIILIIQVVWQARRARQPRVIR